MMTAKDANFQQGLNPGRNSLMSKTKWTRILLDKAGVKK